MANGFSGSSLAGFLSLFRRRAPLALFFLLCVWHVFVVVLNSSNTLETRPWMAIQRSSLFSGKGLGTGALNLREHENLTVFDLRPLSVDPPKENRRESGKRAGGEKPPEKKETPVLDRGIYRDKLMNAGFPPPPWDIREVEFSFHAYPGERCVFELIQRKEPHAAILLSTNSLYSTGFLLQDGEKNLKSDPFGFELNRKTVHWVKVRREGDDFVAFLDGRERGRTPVPQEGPVVSLLFRGGTEASSLDDLTVRGMDGENRPFEYKDDFSPWGEWSGAAGWDLVKAFLGTLAVFGLWVRRMRRAAPPLQQNGASWEGNVWDLMNGAARGPHVLLLIASPLCVLEWMADSGSALTANFERLSVAGMFAMFGRCILAVWALWMAAWRGGKWMRGSLQWGALEGGGGKRFGLAALAGIAIAALGAGWLFQWRLKRLPLEEIRARAIPQRRVAGPLDVNSFPFFLENNINFKGPLKAFNAWANVSLSFKMKLDENSVLRVDLGRFEQKEKMGKNTWDFHSLYFFPDAPVQVLNVNTFAPSPAGSHEIRRPPDYRKDGWQDVEIVYFAHVLRVYVNGRLAQRALTYKPHSGGAAFFSYGDPVEMADVLSLGLRSRPNAVFLMSANVAAQTVGRTALLFLLLGAFSVWAIPSNPEMREGFRRRIKRSCLFLIAATVLYNLYFAYVLDFPKAVVGTQVLLVAFLLAARSAYRLHAANAGAFRMRNRWVFAGVFFLALLEASRFLFPGMEAHRIRPWASVPVRPEWKFHFDNQVRKVNWSFYGKRFLTQSFNRTNEEGKLRMVVQGGSTTWGVGVDRPELVFSEVLERRLNDARLYGKKWEVINAAFQGSNTFTGYQMFQGVLLDYRPDVLLLNYGYNDRFDRGNIGQYERGESIPMRAVRSLGSAAFLERLLRGADLFPMHFRGKSVEFFEKHARAYADLCRDNDVRFLYSLQPHEISREALKSDKGFDPDEAMLDVQKVLPGLAKEGLLETIDLQAPFWERRLDRLFVDDWHLTARGNEAAAETIFEFMSRHPGTGWMGKPDDGEGGNP